jgi:hypothetical protein
VNNPYEPKLERSTPDGRYYSYTNPLWKAWEEGVKAERTRIVGLFDALAKEARDTGATDLQLLHVNMWRIIDRLRRS